MMTWKVFSFHFWETGKRLRDKTTKTSISAMSVSIRLKSRNVTLSSRSSSSHKTLINFMINSIWNHSKVWTNLICCIPQVMPIWGFKSGGGSLTNLNRYWKTWRKINLFYLSTSSHPMNNWHSFWLAITKMFKLIVANRINYLQCSKQFSLSCAQLLQIPKELPEALKYQLQLRNFQLNLILLNFLQESWQLLRKRESRKKRLRK